MPRIDAFLQIGKEQGGSDIHFTVGLPPLVRLDGELLPVKYRALSEDECSSLVGEILAESQRRQLESRGAVDLGYQTPELGRFRINVCRHRRGLAAICRVIPDTVPDLASLGLPRVLSSFTTLVNGLVLVTGAAGTGKSTTLAAMLREINETQHLNLITLEEPVEFVHESRRSMVVQREVGTHVPTFK